MRLLKYFSYSKLDERTNIFRCLQIKLVKNQDDENPRETINYVKEKYSISDDIFELTEKLNKRLKGYYNGQYRFDFTLTDGVPINKTKIPQKIETRLRIQLFESNDILAKIKRKIESE